MHTHTQHILTQNSVTKRVETKKLLSHGRQSDFTSRLPSAYPHRYSHHSSTALYEICLAGRENWMDTEEIQFFKERKLCQYLQTFCFESNSNCEAIWETHRLSHRAILHWNKIILKLCFSSSFIDFDDT